MCKALLHDAAVQNGVRSSEHVGCVREGPEKEHIQRRGTRCRHTRRSCCAWTGMRRSTHKCHSSSKARPPSGPWTECSLLRRCHVPLVCTTKAREDSSVCPCYPALRDASESGSRSSSSSEEGMGRREEAEAETSATMRAGLLSSRFATGHALDWHPHVGTWTNSSAMPHATHQKTSLRSWIPFCVSPTDPLTRLRKRRVNPRVPKAVVLAFPHGYEQMVTHSIASAAAARPSCIPFGGSSSPQSRRTCAPFSSAKSYWDSHASLEVQRNRPLHSERRLWLKTSRKVLHGSSPAKEEPDP